MIIPRLFAVLLLPVFSMTLPTQASAQPNFPDSSGGLNVSAEAFVYSVSNDSPKLRVIIHLLNTTNRDLTVLTKDEASSHFNLSSDKTKFRFWASFDTGLKWDGHPVVPSLYKFEPVTLRPNEVALCAFDVEQNGSAKTLQGLTKDSPIVIWYSISQDFADRYGCWSGDIATKPFHIQSFR